MNHFNFPTPKLSPLERNRRRMSFRNDRTFYSRTCDMTGNAIIALYPQESPYTVYHPDTWYADTWDALDFGREYDFNHPFFDQFLELSLQVPRLSIDIVNCENSNYCNYCGDNKNCYLDIAGEGNEDCMFNLFTKHSKDCLDCTFVYNSQLCYECINCYDCYETTFSRYLDNCNDCHFCFDMKGCKNCLFSYNLRQKQYCIGNTQYSKEEYEKHKKDMLNPTPETFASNVKKYETMLAHAIHRDMYMTNSENCQGNNIVNSKNCHNCFNISNCEDCENLYDVLDAKDCSDLNYSLYKPEASYELISTLQMQYSAFCMASHYCNNSYYCDLCNNSGNLFGCIGLNQKEYCILNKQYSKEAYHEMKDRIIQHMTQTGEWGEFFDPRISPFGYNETVAHEYMPLSKEEALSQGYKWKEETVNSKQLPVNSEGVVICEKTGKPFKIIPQEQHFYNKMNLPLPQVCPDARHQSRMDARPARQLFERTCSKSGEPVWSVHGRDCGWSVYGEKAYLESVY